MHARRCCRRLQSRKTNGFRPNDQWMQQHTYLARLLGGAPLPLTLLAQGTGTATPKTGRIDDAQAPIDFSALLMGTKLLASRTPQRPIGLERKVLTREAVRASCASPPEGEHSPREEPCAVRERGWEEQTRWCAAEWAQTDGPVPGARSRSIDRRFARLLVQPVHDCTSDRGPVRHLHRQAPVQKRHDAGRGPPHQRR